MVMSQSALHRVLELLERPAAPSRNRGEPAFTGPGGRRVHRLYRLYRALLAELERAGAGGARVSARRREGGLLLELVRPDLAYHRSTLVPPPLDGLFSERLRKLGIAQNQ